MLKRSFDILFSISTIILLSPLFLAISISILIDSRGGVFYKQIRIGKNGSDFFILKFRSMQSGSDKKGLLTMSDRDNRITSVGHFIRKYKLDELPQLINVFIGTMSVVGPRPEVPEYVNLYTDEQRKVLTVKPGITDYASIEYRNENEILRKAENPEQLYIQEIMPAKLKLNLKYIEEQSIFTDAKIIVRTIFKIIC